MERYSDTIYKRGKALSSLLKRIREDKALGEEGKATLLEYHSKISGQSISSQEKGLFEAFFFLKTVSKPVKEVEQADVEAWWKGLSTSYKPETLEKKYTQIKKFLRISAGLKKGRYPPCIDNFQPYIPKKQCELTLEEFKTQDEVKLMLEKTYNKGSIFDLRNQAMLALLNDVGARLSEIISMNRKHLKEETSNGHTFLVVTLPESKTQPRTIISYLAIPYLKRWLSVHPLKEPNAPLFISKKEKRIEYGVLRKIFQRVFTRAGFEVPRYRLTRIFRHLFATRCDAFFSQAQKEQWGGWANKTIVNSVYTHLNYKSLVEPYFTMISKECDGHANPMMPRQCKCGHLNPNQTFCSACGTDLKIITPLNEENQTEMLKKVLLENAEVEELMPVFRRIIREEVKSLAH